MPALRAWAFKGRLFYAFLRARARMPSNSCVYHKLRRARAGTGRIGSMQAARIPAPMRSIRSWLYLAGIASSWILARLIEPSGSGATLHGFWLPHCPLKALSGVPCPFCGLTTGVAWLARLQWREAWNSNVLSPVLLFLSAALGAYTILMRLFAGYAVRWHPSECERRRMWLAAVAMVVMSWLVNLLRAF